MTAELRTSGQAGEDPVSDELKPGTELLHGQYTIDGFLNAGGFGVTYLAKDSLDRTVVIKECYPSQMCCRSKQVVRSRTKSGQKEFEQIVRLFGQEARRLSKLRHPCIVGIHQVFEDNGTAYMALDFVEGRDLLDVIEDKENELTPAEIKEILLKVLDAVKYIHENDVLHRDISPDNILLTDDNHPVLIDFGAAREEATRSSRTLSSVNVVKDGYSPQEFYLAGNSQDCSSDLYSLAATFYHLITGDAPPNSQARVSAIAAGRPDPYEPVLRRVKGFDEHFLRGIDKSLSIMPGDRLQSAEDWITLIDTEKRRRAALARAQKDKAMELSISKLVAETNKEVLADHSGGTRAQRAHAEEVKKRIREQDGARSLGQSKASLLPDVPDVDLDEMAPASEAPPQRRSFWSRLFGRGKHSAQTDTHDTSSTLGGTQG